MTDGIRAPRWGGGIRTGASPAVRRADAATRASGHDPRVRNRPEAGARASGACGAPRPRPGPRRPARRRTRCRHREDPGRRPVDLPPANATPQCCASLGDPKEPSAPRRRPRVTRKRPDALGSATARLGLTLPRGEVFVAAHDAVARALRPRQEGSLTHGFRLAGAGASRTNRRCPASRARRHQARS